MNERQHVVVRQTHTHRFLHKSNWRKVNMSVKSYVHWVERLSFIENMVEFGGFMDSHMFLVGEARTPS